VSFYKRIIIKIRSGSGQKKEDVLERERGEKISSTLFDGTNPNWGLTKGMLQRI